MTDKTDRAVSYDCKYFLGDRPCFWHKEQGLICECVQYSPLKESLLIIKLDAIGDVLRTTSLLPVINAAWPGAGITWITRPESVPLLQENPYINEVLPYGADALVHLSTRRFDKVINLDASKISAGMAAMANGVDKIGYLLHEDGYVKGTNEAATQWLRMGIYDDLKKENRQSYQEIMCSILGLPTEGLKYVLELNKIEKKQGREHLENLGMDLKKPIIGIHTGGGGRWTLKQWSEKNFTLLINDLARDMKDVQILLFGGPLEREQNRRVAADVKAPIFDSGCENSLRHFAALTLCCSLMLSGDSLAMHIALAMERRTVVLFGPTSSSEIALYGLGEKVIPDLECLSCYKKTCDFTPNCMDEISVEMVKGAVTRQMALLD